MADEEQYDEVKVFRNEKDTDDDPMIGGETSQQQLADDKKEAVMEAELDSVRIPVDSIKQESKTKSEPSPSFPLMPGLLSGPAFSPNYALPMMIPFFMPSPYALRSPNLMLPMGSTLSPSFQMFPPSPFYGAAAAAMVAKQQLENAAPFHMRGGPLNPLNNGMRIPPYLQQGMTPQGGDQRRTQGGGKVKKEDHIKKPLNAFMWYMKENRKKLLEEIGNNEKQSAELNKELGKRWHELAKDEQQKYFEMAKKDREDHKERYPQWSARENYAVNKKKTKKRRDKSVVSSSDNGETKKCRARFGVNNTEMWCKFCKRKKKCEYATQSEPLDTQDGRGTSGASSSSGSPSPSSGIPPMMTPQHQQHQQHAFMQSMLRQMQLGGVNPMGPGPSPLATNSTGPSPVDADGSDSESDVDEDDEEIDPTITQQTHEVIMQESVCTL